MVYLLLLHFKTLTIHFLLIVCLWSNTRRTDQAPFLFQSQYAGIRVIILPPLPFSQDVHNVHPDLGTLWKDEALAVQMQVTHLHLNLRIHHRHHQKNQDLQEEGSDL